MGELEGKRTLITGAGRGLGRAIAQLCAQRGARLALADIDMGTLEQTAGEIGDAVGTTIDCDVSASDRVQAMIAAATDALGGLDVLVNNAGVEVGKPLVEHTDAEMSRLIDINVKGTFMTTKYAVPALADGGGAIVNMASVAGLGGAPLLSAYCASKGAVLRLTEAAALELRDAGIRVNCVCPTFIDTQMVERLVPPFEALAQAAAGVSFQELVAMRQQRLGQPEEVAEMVAWLASDEADWVTGSHYTLDGGLTAMMI
jgi:NAD(P)-dependent dehydrogenase (short-subunit alcohol dehydrogenase family)